MQQYLTRPIAADWLTARGPKTTTQALADLAHNGGGPRYGIVRGRAVYLESDLEAWLAGQFARPVVPRKGRRQRQHAAGEAA